MHCDLTERFIEAIADQARCPPSRLGPQTDLWDIGVDGDDARDLLLHLGETFEIDLENMQFHWHFGPEAGFNPLAVLWPGWCWRRERTPVTIADLVEAACTRTCPIQYSRGPRA